MQYIPQPLDTLISTESQLNQLESSVMKVHFGLIKQVNLIDNYTIYKKKSNISFHFAQ